MDLRGKLNILALYLPAFHRIKENDEWWGEGFTEWDNVKKGRPLYKNHIQPMIPLEGYYDLSNEQALYRQAQVANQYGVDGFVFYHYWFTGKKLLEKPAEILLKSNIKSQFCFCWANEPWSRTWDGKNNEVLMPQEYGDESDWKEHIEYLSVFFKDQRYLRIEGKPILFIYSASRIKFFDRMISFFNSFLVNHGDKPLYIIEFISSFNPKKFGKNTSAVIEFEPLYTTRFDLSAFGKAKRVFCKKIGLTDYQNYNRLWKKIIDRKKQYGVICYKSCFVGWDNSPRKGKKSMVVKGGNPLSFYNNFKKYLFSKRQNASPFITVINAWNEWGEGAFLEPSVQYQFSYLEAVKKAREEYEKNS